MIKKNKNKVIILILSVIILLIAGVIVWLFFINENNDNVENEIVSEQEELSEARQIEIINNYGKDIEFAITNNNELSYEYLITRVSNDDKVMCSIHEIYADGKIYLDDCTINSLKTSASYGTKQTPENDDSNDDFESEVIIDRHTVEIYYNTKNSKATTEKPANMDGYITYIVTDSWNGQMFSPTISGDFVAYFNSDYTKTFLKNYKTNTDVLPRKDYESIMSISNNGIWLNNYFAVKVNGKWGIYSTDKKKFVVPAIYSYMEEFYHLDETRGPTQSVRIHNGNNIPVCNGNLCGVINYIDNSIVIPIKYHIFQVNDNLLGARELLSSTIKVYDYSGEEYLSNIDKKYGLIGYYDGKEYAFVVEDNHSKIYSLNGTMLYDYGEFLGSDQQDVIYAYLDKIKYRKDNGKCVEYSYNFDTKTGTVSDNIECGY